MADGGGEKRSTGTVKWFNGWKGFGFITPDEEGSEDLFVHQTSIQFDGFRTLYDGQRVEFDVEVGDDGRTRASDVVPLRNSGGGGRGGGRGGRFGGGVECYNCGRFGHLARDCYHQGGDRGGYGGGRGGYGGGRGGYGGGRGGYGGGGRGQGYGGGRGGRYYEEDDSDGAYRRGRGRGRGRGGGRRGGYYGGGGGGGGGRGGGGRGECYNCGEEGHFARDCANAQN